MMVYIKGHQVNLVKLSPTVWERVVKAVEKMRPMTLEELETARRNKTK
jgi:hypothetical protein